MEAFVNNRPSFLLPTCKGIQVIPIDSIIRIEGSSNYSKLFFLDGKTLVVAKLLKWFEEKLLEKNFARIHKTHLVNTNCICQYVGGSGGKVCLSNGEWVSVSKRKKQFFIKSWMAMPA